MEEPPFGVHILRNAQQLTVGVCGELDLTSASRLDAALQRELACPGTHLVLDFHRVTFLDSEGLKVIVRAYRRIAESGGAISIVGCSRSVGRLFDILGLKDPLGVRAEGPD